MTDQRACADTYVSVVVPLYNSEFSLRLLYQGITASLEAFRSWEIIFIDDTSTDRTPMIAQKLADSDSRVKYHRLWQNQGQSRATIIGLRLSRGMRIVTIDDDLEQPPELIPHFFEMIDRGYEVAIARFRNKSHSQLRRLGSLIVGWMWRYLYGAGELTITSYKAFSRDALDAVLAHVTNTTWPLAYSILKTIPAERLINVDVPHGKRVSGRSNYGLIKLARKFMVIIRLAVAPPTS